MVYGIRSLKNGTESVLIGASIVLLPAAMPTISANENLPQAQENISAVTKSPTKTEVSQKQEQNPISEQNNANASLDTKKKIPATETPKKEDTTPSQPNSKEEKTDTPTSMPSSDQKPQADTSSEEPIADNYFRIHVKKLPEENKDSQGLWTWGDVKNPRSGEWPDETDFTATGKHGRYIDIPLNGAAREFGFLLLDESKKGDDVKIRAVTI